jgi:hypothetical protein
MLNLCESLTAHSANECALRMSFKQLHIFLIINFCVQVPYRVLKAIDHVFPYTAFKGRTLHNDKLRRP